jgi:hypothetical protein
MREIPWIYIIYCCDDELEWVFEMYEDSISVDDDNNLKGKIIPFRLKGVNFII